MFFLQILPLYQLADGMNVVYMKKIDHCITRPLSKYNFCICQNNLPRKYFYVISLFPSKFLANFVRICQNINLVKNLPKFFIFLKVCISTLEGAVVEILFKRRTTVSHFTNAVLCRKIPLPVYKSTRTTWVHKLPRNEYLSNPAVKYPIYKR